MLKLPVDSIVNKICQETGLSAQEITTKIKDKIKELDGLVSEEGAAFIIASELGVQLLQESLSRITDIKSLMPGMRNVDVSGRVDSAYPVRSFVKGNETREVGSLRISDSTGDIRVALWDEKPQLIKEGKINRGSTIRIKNGQVKLNQKGEKELHVGMRGTVIVTSSGSEDYAEITTESTIAELRDGQRTSVLAEIVSLFEPKLYFVCPVCNKKVIPAPEGFLCAEHKQVTPLYSMLISLQLDDGTETIRAVAFGKVAEQFCGMAAADIKNSGLDAIEAINARLLGRTVKFIGRAKENKTFARTEFVVTRAELDLNAKELALKMMGGA